VQASHIHNCLEGREFLLYLDGSVSGYSKARIEKHLNLCTRCFEAFIFLFNDFLDGASPQKWDAAATEQRYA
jgi:predicted anti-sigma-YlaC factor YlaD